MSEIRRDLRYASRQLLQHPGFTVAAVLTLTLAIGLNSAVFSAVNALLFRPLPVAEPAELVAVYSSEPGDFMARSPLSAFDFEELAAETRAFAEVLAYTYTPLAVEHGDDSRLVLGVRATRDVFAVLGIEAALGRAFSDAAVAPGETADPLEAGKREVPATPDEVVLSHNAWRRWYGADPEVVGTVLRIDGRAATVVGVAPEQFFGLTRGVAPELWLPLPSPLAAADRHQDRELRGLWVIGRLAAGATRGGQKAGHGAAQAELQALGERLARTYPDTHRQRQFVALPADSVRILPGVDTTLAAASAVVLAMVGLVLLIASANVAHLLLARAFDRRREIATRLALGAGPGTIVRQLLTESLLLALLGGGAGLLLALGSNAALGALRLPLPVELDLGLAIDGRVVLYTLAASLCAALAFGLAPALAAARTDLTAHLGAGTTGSGRSRGRLGGALVVTQVALSLLLLVAAARLETLEETLGWALFLPRSAAALFGLFGLLGLALAAIGLAGVLGYAVRRRTREIGIRMALGAGRRQILGLVLRQGLTLTLAGVALGLTVALATTRTLAAALYGVAATDPPTFAGAAAFLILVALLATWLPARRAAGVDPGVSLR